MPEVPDKLMTAEDVAAALQVTVQTVANYCKAGVFPGAFKTGPGRTSAWRIPHEDFSAYMEEQKKRAQATKA
ncbi:MAG: helix-turn-helix domain-containing protein [Anaerolineales bacterium]|nr:helix-turn-helix domain-containing protein [Anaerolineales bacterium]